MAHLKLSSDNPELSFVLYKNPATGMQIAQNKRGHLFGYYHDGDYCVYFHDDAGKSSYADGDFEHLDLTRHSSPHFVLDAAGAFFDHLGKKDIPQDAGSNNAIEFVVYAKRAHLMHKVAHHTTDVEVQAEEIAPNHWRARLSNNGTVARLVDAAVLMALVAYFSSHEHVYITDEVAAKYTRLAARLALPYYPIAILKSQMLFTRALFDAHHKALAEACTDDVEFEFGSSHAARIRAIGHALHFSDHLLDVGCGEGRYLHLARKIKGRYLGVDPDDEVRAKAERQVRRKRHENVEIAADLPELPFDGEPFEIILSEVIEHMPLAKAEALVRELITKPGMKRLVVTTPNRAFNDVWEFEENQMRHDDHDWEMTRSEFETWVLGLLPHGFTALFRGVGDRVGNQRLSTMAVIEPA